LHNGFVGDGSGGRAGGLAGFQAALPDYPIHHGVVHGAWVRADPIVSSEGMTIRSCSGQLIGRFSGTIAPPETMKAIASFFVQSSQASRDVGTSSTNPDVGFGVVGT